MEKIVIYIDKNWLYLKIKNDQSISYPIFGSNRDIQIDEFAKALKKALNGERLSDLY